MPTPQLILASQSPRRAKLLSEAGFAFEQIAPPFQDPAQPVPLSPTLSEAIDDPVRSLVIDLATRKAQSLAQAIAQGEVEVSMHRDTLQGDPVGSAEPAATSLLLIGADTVCCEPDGTLIGTPQAMDEARAMIQRFRNGVHDVATGVAIIKLERCANGSWRPDDCQNHPAEISSELDTSSGPTMAPCCAFADVVEVTVGDLSDKAIEDYLATGQWQGKAGGYNLFDRQTAGWPVKTPSDLDPTTVVGLPMNKLTRELRQLGVEATGY